MPEKNSTARPWWQQATALVSVSTGGVVTGLTFAPGTAATLTSPDRVPPVHLMALEKAASADSGSGTHAAHEPDAQLRPAVVNVARYYLRLAKTRTPGQMNALIWGRDSLDGADHGSACAAFASLTLELGAQAVGQRSWVSGGESYPWPVHSWVDARVGEPDSPATGDSPGITSVVRDAQAHGRWHAPGDGYQPQPGDWVVFDQHIEVVTGYSGGVLDTIGADSLPGYTINAHTFRGPLAGTGVAGFVDNGGLAPAESQPAAGPGQTTGRQAAPSRQRTRAVPQDSTTEPVIPGSVSQQPPAQAAPAPQPKTSAASAVIPGPAASVPAAGGSSASSGGSAPRHYTRHAPPAASSSVPAPAARSQREFISSVVPGAIAAQQRWGVPASVTIAQAIEESNWGSSQLAAASHNLFGIKGAGPAGSAYYPTQEFEGGQWITVNAAFRAYRNDAESISDHAELLATSGHYHRAMADRHVPDAFASDLTGIYATDPDYGANLISIMKLYDLYRYDTARTATGGAAAHPTAPAPKQPSAGRTGAASIPGVTTARLAPASRYQAPLPAATATAYFTTARTPVGRAEQLYRDVAGRTGISWKLLAACDWMQCQAHPRYSPVHGEKLGSVNRDGSVYATKSEALTQTAADMVALARAVYGIDLTVPRPMSVRQLAEVFAAFRWGGLLKKHGVSAMEFPYSVAGLTDGHPRMHWPAINEKVVPDKPGSRFKQPFGAVPAVLSLKYPATV